MQKPTNSSQSKFVIVNIFRILILLFNFLFVSTILVAKPTSINKKISQIDSLLITLNQTIEDTSKINILNEIAWNYRKINKDSALYYANIALHENSDHHYFKGAIKSYNTLGTIHYINSEFELSINNFIKALDLSYEINDMNYVAKMSNNIGILYKLQGRFNEALKYNIQSLKLKEQSKDTIGIINSFINIGSLYYQLNKFEEGVEFIQKGLELGKLISSNKVPLMLNTLGSLYTQLDKFDKAIEYLEKALKINIQNNDEKRIAINYQNLANVYVELKDFEIAMSYYKKTLELKLKLDNKKGIAKTEMGIGVLAFEMGNFKFGIKHLEKARIYYEQTGQIFELKSIYEFLAKSYSALNQDKKAFDFLSQSYEISDSLYSIESKAIIEELEKEYETHKKDLLIENQEIELSKAKEAVRFYIIIAIILILGIFVIAWLYNKKQKSNKKLAEKNYELAAKFEEICKPKTTNNITNKHQKIFNDLINKINTDQVYTDINLTIDILAKEIGTNRTELSEVINLFLKKNYSTFINELRVKHAVRLLTKTNQKYSLGGIAKESGFKSESNFYKQFKQFTGLKPVEYKNQLENH